jgi:hypothetical protein
MAHKERGREIKEEKKNNSGRGRERVPATNELCIRNECNGQEPYYLYKIDFKIQVIHK